MSLCLISLRQSPLKLLLACLLVLTTKGLLTLGPVLIGMIIDGFTKEQMSQILWFVGAYLGCGIAAAALLPMMRFVLSCVLQKTILYLSNLWTDEILSKELSFFHKDQIGSKIQIIDRGILASEKLLHFALVLVLPAVFELIIVIGYIIFSGGGLLVITLIGFAIIVAIGFNHLIGWRREFIRELCHTEDHQGKLTLELFRAAKTLKICGVETQVIDLLRKNLHKYAAAATAQRYAQAKLTAFEQLAIQLGGALVIAFGWIAVHGEQRFGFSAGEFLVWFVLSQRLLTSLLSLAQQWKAIDQAQTETEPLDRLRNHDQPNSPPTKNPAGWDNSSDLHIYPCQIKLQNSAESIWIKQHIKIPDGSHVALIGASGQGKTYLAEALSGLHPCEENQIFIGNTDLSHHSQNTLAQKLYMAESNPSLLHGNFWHSIFLGKFSEAQDKRDLVYKTIKELGLTKFEQQLGGQEFFRVDTCSAGEKKRLGLLRAFALRKSIIILDEPTASLDPELAKQIWSVIFHHFKDQTLICITHDRSTLERFDMVLEFLDHRLYQRIHHKRTRSPR